MADTDFMPLDGWDHVELWVGNAKQAAFWYEHALGFDRVAYAGPETGVRDRASYVLEQGEIRLVLTSGLRADSEIVRHVARHGDGARDISLQVPDAAAAFRIAVERGATAIVAEWSQVLSHRSKIASSPNLSPPATPRSSKNTASWRVGSTKHASILSSSRR